MRTQRNGAQMPIEWASNLSSPLALYYKTYYAPYGLLPNGNVDEPFEETPKVATGHQLFAEHNSRSLYVRS